MKINAKYLSLAFLLGLSLIVGQMCTKQQTNYNNDPIVGVGHGALFGPDGKELNVTEDMILSSQQYFIDKLLSTESANKSLLKEALDKIKSSIYELVDDKIVANTLFLNELINKVNPQNKALLISINNGLSSKYEFELNKQKKKSPFELLRKADSKLVRDLKGRGLNVFMVTTNSGEAYCEECKNQGVPIPKNMFGPEWKNLGEFDKEFISTELRAELMIYESDNPKGVCLALPRYFDGTDNSNLFGVICLGTETGKVCFFDNPRGKSFKKNEVVSFKNWLGGIDLIKNSQGVCTDCHAGENPYVVHPEKAPFAGIINKLKSPIWYDPLVDSSWPQNLGPNNILAGIPSEGKCSSCHTQGNAGRFPIMLSGYCSEVFKNAIGELDISKKTMPPYGDDINLYLAHINALKSQCGTDTPGGKIVDNKNTPDPTFLSPPMVIDPLYQCATAVAVRGVAVGSKVKLFVNGMGVGTVTNARDPDKTEFFGIPALNVGDKVTATQEIGGAVSNPSAIVTVRDYKIDYPSGVPTPKIDPTLIYECAEVISVRHLPGATVTVFVNGSNPVSFIGSTDWTLIKPGKAPFAIGDKFTAQAALCTDKSGISTPAIASVKAPTFLPTPIFDPSTIFNGQELISLSSLTNGAFTEIDVSGGGVAKFTTSISWKPNFDIASQIGRKLNSGDILTTTQLLCNTKSRPGRTTPAANCASLTPPAIQHPVVGSNFVVVSNAVPGARILVYDSSGKEIGDGSGSIIILSRAITANDTLFIVQQVGECISSKAYQVSVRSSAKIDNKKKKVA
jgi:hypothetical protein